MTVEQNVAQHYSHGSLAEAIVAALAKAGIGGERIDADQLAPVDEFHTGGRQATVEFAEQLAFPKGAHLLDVGSGIGGPARYFAKHRGCRVSGVDLTEEYVRVATELTRRTGQAQSVDFRQGSALALPFAPATFDGAYMIHVGMNIADKHALAVGVRATTTHRRRLRALVRLAIHGAVPDMGTGSDAVARDHRVHVDQ